MKLFSFLVFMIASTGLYAQLNWPLQEPQVRRVFAQKTLTGLQGGVDLGGTSPEVLSPGKGEILLIIDPAKSSFQNIPSSLGGIVVLAHDENLRTALCQIQPSAVLRTKQSVAQGERIGTVLDPENPRARLFVFDQELKKLVNPQVVLPNLDDRRAPLIFSAELLNEEDRTKTVSLFRQNRAETGFWYLTLDAGDPFMAGDREGLRGIYSINAFHNGTEFFRLSASALLTKSGKFYFEDDSEDFPLAPAGEIRLSERTWNLGKLFLTEGTNIIELIITDYAGNESGKTFNLRGGRF